MFRMMVVLPDPAKPVTMVIGMRLGAAELCTLILLVLVLLESVEMRLRMNMTEYSDRRVNPNLAYPGRRLKAWEEHIGLYLTRYCTWYSVED